MTDYAGHRAVIEGKKEILARWLANGGDADAKDPHGNSPLHLAAMLGKEDCMDCLLASESSVSAKNLLGWTPLDEARSFGDRNTITKLVKALRQQQRTQLDKRKPNLAEALKKFGDFKMEIHWDFHSWLPFVSRFLPSDTAVIYKRGSCVRIDTTIVDFSEMRWVRGDMSFLYNSEVGKGVVLLDNENKRYQRIVHQENDKETNQEVDLLMSSDIISVRFTVQETCFTKATSGFIFRSERTGHIGNFDVEYYHLDGFRVVQRKRREHLSAEDIKKNKAMLDVFSSATGATADFIPGCPMEHRPSLPAPSIKRISWNEYIQAAPGKYSHVGRPLEEKTSSKSFRPTVGMSTEFPLTLETLLNVLEATPFKHFKKLKEFVELQLPPGFPVRLELPVLPTITGTVTFTSFEFDDNISLSLFQIPNNYTAEAPRIIGSAAKNPPRRPSNHSHSERAETSNFDADKMSSSSEMVENSSSRE